MSDIYKEPSGYPPPGGYGPPPGPYAPPGGYGPGGFYPPPRRTNGMAIASLVVSCASFFVCGLLAVVGAILGHVARKQIRETGEEGDGLALAGIIVGWIVFGLSVLVIGGYIVFFIVMASTGQLD